MAVNRRDVEERLARIERMIQEYEAARKRALLQRAIKTWRRAEARHRRATRPVVPERFH
jgi:hypothetical protein